MVDSEKLDDCLQIYDRTGIVHADILWSYPASVLLKE
jgi:hypothetical protein